MARRRARTREAKQASPEPEVEQEEQPQEEIEEEQPENGDHEHGSDCDHDHDHDHEEDAGERQSLKFNEELSWRPAKPIASATLVARLERLSQELADFDQEAVDLDSLKDVAEKLAHRNLLQHKDKGVKAYTACCLVDILRLFVPDAPFTDDQLKVRHLRVH